MSERARSGLALGSGLALVVVGAVLVPSAQLVREHGFGGVVVPALVDAGPEPGVDVSAARLALIDVERAIARAQAAAAQLELRAREAERGERLRQLGRAVAKARELRRGQGQSGPQLRGPFPLSELGWWGGVDGSLSPAKGANKDLRWVLDRDGALLGPDDVVPLGPDLRASLATSGHDEDPLVLRTTLDGQPATLIRRCVPAEAYCIVDVDAPTAVVVDIDVAALGRSIDALARPPRPAPAPSPPPPSSAAELWLALAIGAGLAVVVVVRLRRISGSIVGATLRLRGGLAGRPAPAPEPLARELHELEVAIDDVFSALGQGAGHAAVADDRRERLTMVAEGLDAARGQGGVPRLPTNDADDALSARLVQSTNGLLDALDERTRRFKALLDDASDQNTVLPTLAQRLLRLARVQGVPPPLVDELTSLGNAVAARVGGDVALDLLQTELTRFLPRGTSSDERLATVAALRDLPAADIVRHTRAEPALPTPGAS